MTAGRKGGQRPAAAALAEGGWEAVVGELFSEVCHDLNGGAAGLEGLAYVLGVKGDAAELVDEFRARVASLEATSAALGLLREDPDARAEACLTSDLLQGAMVLHRLARPNGGFEATVSEDLPALKVGPGRMRRLAVLLMHRAADVRGTVRIEAVAEEDGVSLRIVGDAPAEIPEALAAVAALDGGSLAVDGAGGVVLRYPALKAAGVR